MLPDFNLSRCGLAWEKAPLAAPRRAGEKRRLALNSREKGLIDLLG